MGEYSIRGLLLEKRKIYKCSYEKKLGEIYTGEIHGFAKMHKVEYIVPLGLLLDHVVFYKNRDNRDLIRLCSKVSHDRLRIMLETLELY